MGDSKQHSYRQIMKATSIFGGVQIFQILVGVIRSKFIAVLLGPTGMGIFGLLQASMTLIAGLTNFGLSTSAIKNLSAVFSEANEEKIGRTVALFRRIIWMTGLIGSIITLLLSPYLSEVAFGNKDYTLAFSILSISILCTQLSSGENTIIQAAREIKFLAKSNIVASTIALLTTVPLYYAYGINSIVPGMIITAFTGFFLSRYFSSRLLIKPIKINFSEFKIEGREMLLMGFFIGMNGIILNASSYLIRIFIGNFGSVDDVGLYNAGFTMVHTYFGMVFSAMAIDYYPKLSMVAHDVPKLNMAVNQQAVLGLKINEI